MSAFVPQPDLNHTRLNRHQMESNGSLPGLSRLGQPVLTQKPVTSNQSGQHFAQACPLRLPAPGSCPFGGICHSCPRRVQAKLTVSQPGDPYEQEADRVAEQVMTMSQPSIQRACPACDEEEAVQTKPLAEQITPLVQRQPGLKEEEEEPVQTKLVEGAQVQRQEKGLGDEEEEEPVQVKQSDGRPPQVIPNLEQQIHSLRGGGQPLPQSTRDFFEPRFGTNFSQVRVHTDGRAAGAAEAMHARAFTLGQDIIFGTGQYAPDLGSGRQLVAHELAHTIQQGSARHGLQEKHSSRLATLLSDHHFQAADQLQRLVRPSYVSCNPPSPAIAAITGADPVGALSAAVDRAVELLDNVIDELETTRNNIIAGAPAAAPTISDAVALAIRNRFRINPENRNVWTGSGAGSIYVLLRRFRAVRSLLDGGWIRYTCLAGAYINTPSCAGPGCVGATRAAACPGVTRIFLCRPFWAGTLDDRARILIHESHHVYYGFIGDTGHLGNAHCYAQFVLELNNLTVPAIYVGMCP